MKKGSILIITGCILVVIELIGILCGLLLGVFDLLLGVFGLLAGILCIILGVFGNKGYYPKNFFLACFSVIALWGLILLYILLFRTNDFKSTYIFYFEILFVLLIISFGGSYILRIKKGNL
jgi:hypothetical protein